MTDSPPAEAPPKRKPLVATAFRWLVGVLGVSLLVVLVREVGFDALMEVLAPALPWVPSIAALEMVRIGFDALATRQVLGSRADRVGFRVLYGAQLVAHAVMNVIPAGRSASEAMKAVLLAPHLGGAPAAAMGYTNQANVLISSGLFTVLCLVGAFASPEPTLLVAGLLAHTFVLVMSGVGMRFAATSPRVARRIERHLPRLWRRIERFHHASRETPMVAPKPILAMFAGRTVQTIEYAVIAFAVGLDIGVLEALAVQGTNLVAAAVGVFVPGQVGSAEAVFAAAAEVLDTTVARAMSIALLSHAVQLILVGAGFVLLFLWRARRRAGTA